MDRRGAPALLRNNPVNEPPDTFPQSPVNTVQSRNRRQTPKATRTPSRRQTSDAKREHRRVHPYRGRNHCRRTEPCSLEHEQPSPERPRSDPVRPTSTGIPDKHHAFFPTLHHVERTKLGAPRHTHDNHRHAATRRKRPHRCGRPMGIRTMVRVGIHQCQQRKLQGALRAPPARRRPRTPSVSERQLRRTHNRRHLNRYTEYSAVLFRSKAW